MILQGADHLEACPVADVGQSRVPMSAEIALEDPAVGCPVKQGAPGLQFLGARRSLLGMDFGHHGVVQVLTAAHGVSEVDAPVVAIIHVPHRRRQAAFGHHSVRLTEQGFRQDGCSGAGRRCLHGRPQSSSTSADHQHIVLERGIVGQLDDPPIGDRAHGTEPYVDIGQAHPDQAAPGKQLMSAVEVGNTVVAGEPGR